MRLVLYTLAFSLLAHATVLPSGSADVERNGDSESKGYENKSGGFDVNKPVAIVTAETLRAMINTVLAGSVIMNMAQSTAEAASSALGQPKLIN
ncbi:hypothetical protein DSO57_1021652 [Entomophthora muscae]|uniref:Uncharacterized protein n=1 Tax=Entomophthora muscae TaxID=34485 RepID=A0ACC2TQB5_9FUNG|nr:hypothetical protein DSO57_1021652 [Entomophthora muscae]